MALRIEYHRGGVYLPTLRLWLDAHDPKTERVFVSHAHSDHVDYHREVILSAPTSRLMQARIGGTRIEHVLPWRERREFEDGGPRYAVTLLPAGHIFGSAMSLIEADGASRALHRRFQVAPRDCPRNRANLARRTSSSWRRRMAGRSIAFPPTDAVMKGVIRFCREALDNDEVPVLLGYSLGKSQELLCGLGDAGLPIMLHGTVFKMTQVYEQFGQCFPKYEPYEPGQTSGKVLLCPPSVVNSAMLRNLGKHRTAVLTGWAVDLNCKYQYRADAAFPISDHADFPDLIDFVKQVNPKRVLTLHGFAADFAQTLRELGYDAQALSEDEQMTLGLGSTVSPSAGRSAARGARPTRDATSPANVPTHSTFRQFAETCASIASTSSKLEKIRLLSEYLRALEGDTTAAVAVWFTGAAFSSSENKVLKLGWAVIRDALCAMGQVDESDLHSIYLKHSDLGETAQEVFASFNAASAGLSIAEVDEMFRALEAARGPRAKLPVLLAVLEKCDPLEAKFLVKIITGDLRIGLKEGLVEEAIAAAFNAPADEVRQANLLLGNIGQTALLARENRLREAGIVPFRPVKFMLASPEPTAADIWKRVHNPESPDAPVWIEDKYDGVRCQLHKVDGRVALYSRDLKDITPTFHEISDAARALPCDVILDGEVLAMRGDSVLPFAELQRRLGRREHDLFMREEVPVKFVAFDMLWKDGTSLLQTPLRERRRLLESLALPGRVSPGTHHAREVD